VSRALLVMSRALLLLPRYRPYHRWLPVAVPLL
jgi:hypothetical protein